MILAMVNLKKICSYLKDIEYAGMDTRIASKQPIKVETVVLGVTLYLSIGIPHLILLLLRCPL